MVGPFQNKLLRTALFCNLTPNGFKPQLCTPQVSFKVLKNHRKMLFLFELQGQFYHAYLTVKVIH